MDSPNDSTQQPYPGISMFNDLSAIAYVRPVQTENGLLYAVCAADSTPLATFKTLEAAYIVAKQHDLEPLSLH